MALSIKHRSGGSLVDLANLFHDTIADMYRERYAAVPVTVRKHRLTIAQVVMLREQERANARAILHQQYVKDCLIYD